MAPLRPSSLSTPWLGMILILPLEIWAQVDRNGCFLRRCPPNPPSPRRLWPGQAGQSLTSPSCLPSPSPEGPQSMVNFPGDFLGEILALPSKCFGTPRKNPCKNPCNICTNNSCKQSAQKSAQKNRAKNRAKKSVQKIRAENPCKKSVQKIRAKNPCRKSVQKSVQKICAKQTRANGLPKVTLQIEKPNIQQENVFVLFFCKLSLAKFTMQRYQNC